MKNKALILTVALGIMGLFGCKADAEGSRMVCFPENEARTNQDQSSLACRYHWAKTVYGTKQKLYRCYIQFKEDGVKILDQQAIAEKVTPNIDIKGLKEDVKQVNENAAVNKLQANKIKSDAIKSFLLKSNALPVQAMLGTTKNEDGDQVLTTGVGSRPLFLQFSDPYPQENFDILKKANYGMSSIDDLKKVISHFSQFESWKALIPHLDEILPCLGCVDLDGKCIKK